MTGYMNILECSDGIMQFKRGTINKGSLIKAYIPKNREANKVTIKDPFQNQIKRICIVAIMGAILITIGCIVS